MVWTQDKIPNLQGRTAVVTGANAGLGYETVLGLAKAGAHVVMGSRNQEKAQSAKTSIEALHPDASLEIVELDLANLESVALAANAIAVNHRQLDLLVNNAGLMGLPETKTADGFEMMFGVNHLGHWALTAQLMPMLLVTAGSRVVTVTSVARHMCFKLNEKNPHLEGRYKPGKAYGQSKLANYHFGIGLNRKLGEARVSTTSILAHPGLTNTNLLADSAVAGSGMSPATGVRPQLLAATKPGVEGGTLYAPRFVSTGPAVRVPIMRRLGMSRSIERLWRVSERETGIKIELPS